MKSSDTLVFATHSHPSSCSNLGPTFAKRFTLLYYVPEGRWKVVIEERQIRPKPRNWKKIEEWSAVHQCPSVFSLKMNGSLEIQHLDRTLWCIFQNPFTFNRFQQCLWSQLPNHPNFLLCCFHTSRFIRFNRFTCLRCVDWSSVQSHNSSIAGAPKVTPLAWNTMKSSVFPFQCLSSLTSQALT